MSLEKVDVPGYEGRYVLDPNKQEVFSLKSNRPLKMRYDSSGYPEVHLYGDNKDEYKRVHRLFAESYIPNPDNLPYVNHKDEDKTNFSLDNLEWCTHSYNQRYGTVNERRGPKISAALRGKPKTYNSGRPAKPVVATDDYGNETYFASGREAARSLGVRQSKITDILSGKRKTSHGYTFRYDV